MAGVISSEEHGQPVETISIYQNGLDTLIIDGSGAVRFCGQFLYQQNPNDYFDHHKIAYDAPKGEATVWLNGVKINQVTIGAR